MMFPVHNVNDFLVFANKLISDALNLCQVEDVVAVHGRQGGQQESLLLYVQRLRPCEVNW